MSDAELPLGHHTGPREHWFAKVQIMGGPAQGWRLFFDQQMIEAFLRARMSKISFGAPEDQDGERNIRFSMTFPPGYIVSEGSGVIRLEPAAGLFFDQFTYGLTYDLMEAILENHPENQEIVLAFEEFRALFYKPGMPRNEGIFRLTEAVHTNLSKLLFPHDWGSE